MVSQETGDQKSGVIKMIKYMLIILFLMGCDNRVTREMIEKSNFICTNFGGIEHIHLPGTDSVKCVDGLYADIHSIELLTPNN